MQSNYFALEPVIVERLKDIEGISKDDFNIIHTYYFKRLHESKKQ